MDLQRPDQHFQGLAIAATQWSRLDRAFHWGVNIAVGILLLEAPILDDESAVSPPELPKNDSSDSWTRQTSPSRITLHILPAIETKYTALCANLKPNFELGTALRAVPNSKFVPDALANWFNGQPTERIISSPFVRAYGSIAPSRNVEICWRDGSLESIRKLSASTGRRTLTDC